MESYAKTSGVKVLRRAAAILRVIRDAPDGMSLGQIALKIGLPRSTVQRIVKAFQDERLVTWSTINGGIVLGPEMRALAEASRYDIISDCRIVLQEIAEATGETADLSVLRAEGMILLDQVAGTHRLRTVTPVGEVFPLCSTANGRASLALLEDAVARDLLSRQRPPCPVARELSLLPEIRKTGLAYDIDEHTEGVRGIGTAFRDSHGDIYALSVPIPRSRFDARRMSVEYSLLRARDTVECLMV
ncbi:IclR family transcriptional regulator [Thioclava dalianensis]|uniref:IclR family transcriptional regulator n=1 Tax=Thioclava dalianensis TaxID=1185766 RepID=A0A074TGI8_9RHOB|nr:IclR family transcriptional regulator [Thioclava dalianensis]KEP68173.1 IclR family transcriptional regulator [Thioclava dalianensis]SFN86023.1 transcriptional regulator, IclR family [Thioclava dalianensis]